MKGYLDAIQHGDEVTTAQVEVLIDRISKMIKEEEDTNFQSDRDEMLKMIEEIDIPSKQNKTDSEILDDLPF